MPTFARCLLTVGTLWVVALLDAAAAAPPSTCPIVGFTVVEPHATPKTRALRMSHGRTLFVHRQMLTTTTDITDIRLNVGGGNDDDATLQLKYTPIADQRLHEATTNHSGMRIAFLFDDEVLINVVWQGPYGMELGGGQVSMLHGARKAHRLMQAIAGCTASSAAK